MTKKPKRKTRKALFMPKPASFDPPVSSLMNLSDQGAYLVAIVPTKDGRAILSEVHRSRRCKKFLVESQSAHVELNEAQRRDGMYAKLSDCKVCAPKNECPICHQKITASVAAQIAELQRSALLRQ